MVHDNYSTKYDDPITIECSEIILNHMDIMYVSVQDYSINEELFLWTCFDRLVRINFKEKEYERETTEIIEPKYDLSNLSNRQTYSMIFPWQISLTDSLIFKQHLFLSMEFSIILCIFVCDYYNKERNVCITIRWCVEQNTRRNSEMLLAI